jgi:hypothetical protein
MDPVTGQALGALTMIVVTTAVLYVAVVYQRRKALLPGPWPWPIVGSLPVMLTPLPHRALQRLSNKHGGLMYLQLGMIVYVRKELLQHCCYCWKMNSESSDDEEVVMEQVRSHV